MDNNYEVEGVVYSIRGNPTHFMNLRGVVKMLRSLNRAPGEAGARGVKMFDDDTFIILGVNKYTNPSNVLYAPFICQGFNPLTLTHNMAIKILLRVKNLALLVDIRHGARLRSIYEIIKILTIIGFSKFCTTVLINQRYIYSGTCDKQLALNCYQGGVYKLWEDIRYIIVYEPRELIWGRRSSLASLVKGVQFRLDSRLEYFDPNTRQRILPPPSGIIQTTFYVRRYMRQIASFI